MSDDILRTFIYVVVILLAPINIYVTYRLLRLSHSTNGSVKALSERATVSVLLAVGSVSGAILSLARLTDFAVTPTSAIFLNGISAIVMAVPALYWYIKYKTNGFDGDG